LREVRLKSFFLECTRMAYE